MKRIAFLFFVPGLFLTMACNNGAPASEAVINTTITHVEMTGPSAKTVANLSISGMTCSAGCGGKIQQELRALQGVTGTSLDFSENRPDNIVSVEFDPEKVTEQQLIQCVQGISDGQYHVGSAEVVSYKPSENVSAVGADVKSYDFGRVFQLLNLLQSVSRFIE